MSKQSTTVVHRTGSNQLHQIPQQLGQQATVDLSNSKRLLRSTTKELSKSLINLTPRKRALAKKNKSTVHSPKQAISRSSDAKLGSKIKTVTSTVTPSRTAPSTITPSSSSSSSSRATSISTITATVRGNNNAATGNPDSTLKSASSKDDNNTNPCVDSDIDPEQKTILFNYPDVKILSFEQLDNDQSNMDKGRLLGMGKFEIFQLHQNRVSYFQCGGSVIHPILPRLKILKISSNQFIVPLSNPERYWRIVLSTENSKVLQDLETILQKICQFRNLNLLLNGGDDSNHTQSENSPVSQKREIPTKDSSQTLKDQTPGSMKSPVLSKNHHSTNSTSSITTDVACFALGSDTSTYVEQPALRSTSSNTPSIASSLDYALDEFFNNIEPQHDTTQFFTPDPSFHFTSSSPFAEESKIDVITRMGNKHSTIHTPNTIQQRSFISNSQMDQSDRTRSSRSTSLYAQESSWMDPTDGPVSSTPIRERKRYISLNLNPKISTNSLSSTSSSHKKHPMEPMLSFSKQRMNKNTLRYSSYDVYNILQDVEDDSTPQESGLITGFIKSLF